MFGVRSGKTNPGSRLQKVQTCQRILNYPKEFRSHHIHPSFRILSRTDPTPRRGHCVSMAFSVFFLCHKAPDSLNIHVYIYTYIVYIYPVESLLFRRLTRTKFIVLYRKNILEVLSHPAATSLARQFRSFSFFTPPPFPPKNNYPLPTTSTATPVTRPQGKTRVRTYSGV